MKNKLINHSLVGKGIGTKYYFSERNFNGLFVFDFETQICKLIFEFKGEEASVAYLHRNCIQYNQKLFFLPQKSSYIHIYDIETATQGIIDISKETESYIYDVAVEGKYAYYFQMNPPSIICLDMESCTVKRSAVFTEWCKSNIHYDNWTFTARMAYSNGKIYIPVQETNCIVEWDICTNEGKLYETGIHKLSGIYKSSNGFWLTAFDSDSLWLWNTDNSNMEYILSDGINTNVRQRYFHIIEFDEIMIIIPAYSDYLIIKENKSNEWKTVKIPYEPITDNEGSISMFGYDTDGKNLYILFGQGYGIVTVELDSRNVKWTPVIFIDEKAQKLKGEIVKRALLQEACIGERINNDVSGFCKAIEMISYTNEVSDSDYGKNIMNEIKNK